MSFYGGKQGRTYNIIERFDAVSLSSLSAVTFSTASTYNNHDIVINDGKYYILTQAITTTGNSFPSSCGTQLTGMVDSFANGGGYTTVNYGQYVIIDTILNLGQKSSLENGLLYRRGFNYSQDKKTRPNRNDQETYFTVIETDVGTSTVFDEGKWATDWSSYIREPGAGAIYVGQIVGADGSVPKLNLVTWSQISTVDGVNKTSLTLPTTVTGDTENSIEVAFVNIQDDFGNNQGAKIGFKIPYTVQTVTIDTNPYTESEYGVTENSSTTANHFKYQWDFVIPRGKHGAGFTEAGVKKGKDFIYNLTLDESIDSDKTYYIKFDDDYYVVDEPSEQALRTYYERNEGLIDSESVGLKEDDSYFSYKLIDYDDSPQGQESEDRGLFPWRMINEITGISSTRLLLNKDEDGDTVEIPTTVSLGNLVSLEGNKFLVCIKAGNRGIPSTVSSSNYSIGQIYPTSPETGDALWRAIEISQQAPPHGFNIDYTYGDNDQVIYPVYDYFYVDSTGKFYVKRIDAEGEQHYDYISTLESLKSMDYDAENGTITINYISGDSTSVAFKTIKQLYLERDRTQSQQLKVSYLNGSTVATTTAIDGKINTILDAKMQGDFLVVLFSDPEYRNALTTTAYRENEDYFYLSWTDPDTGYIYDGGTGQNHREKLPWIKLSNVNGQYHVFTILDGFDDLVTGATSTYSAGGDIPTTYSTGLDPSHAGWLIQVNYNKQDGTTPGSTVATKGLFAFDYNGGEYVVPAYGDNRTSHWFEVMSAAQSIVANPLDHMLFSEENSYGNPVSDASQLKINGAWFVISNGHHS